jgi:tRNA(adenine34) deaminase
MTDSYFMQKALLLARKAAHADEVPIGAVVVSAEGVILGGGYNQTVKKHAQSRHAEVCAIERAGRRIHDWRLDNCTVYVTLQPCIMCMGLMCLSRISRLVYGAQSPLFGYDGLDSLPCFYKKHLKGISAGVLAEESQSLLEQFFKQKRKKGEQLRTDQESIA